LLRRVVFQPQYRPLTMEDASYLVRFLRGEVMSKLGLGPREGLDMAILDRLNNVKTGVFVSIEKIVFSDGMFKRVLRGSMGTVKPMKGLVSDAAAAVIHASLYDPRFSPISVQEFRNCVIELTLTSEPLDVDSDWVLRSMVLGYHGLQVSMHNRTMVILPQKFVELAEAHMRRTGSPMNTMDVLREICRPDCSSVRIKAFETQIIYEIKPGGNVVERKLYLNRLFRR